MSARRWPLLALLALAVALLAGRALASLYADFRWYAALGAASLWRTKTVLALVLRTLSGLAATLFVFANLYAVRRSVASLQLPGRVANLEFREEVPGRYLTLAVGAVSLLLGAFLTVDADAWLPLAGAIHGVPFGEQDPYFGYDLGFFVYWLPFERALYVWALITLILVAALVTFLYSLTRSLRWERGTLHLSGYVRRHLSTLAALLLFVMAWMFRLQTYGLLVDGSGPDAAFTWVDHQVLVPANLILLVVTVCAAALVLFAGWTAQVRLAFIAVTAVILLTLALHQVVPFLARRLAAPAEVAARERNYDATRADYTRRAYGVDRVSVAESTFGFASAAQAARGTSAWDAPALVRALERTRRTSVPGGAIGWQTSRAGLLALAVERPGASGGAPGGPWTLTRVLASAADERGGAVRVDAGGAAVVDEQPLDAPIVYDSADGYAIVADSARRLVGVDLEGGLSRLAHAWSLQDFRLLAADLPQPRPVIVLRPDVRERVAALAPFFAQETGVAPVWAADSLYWVLHLYSASRAYPLAEHIAVAGDERTYFQHAAVAIVHAGTGAVTIVPDSTLDPYARTWTALFPDLFERWSALPSGIAAAIPPPADGLHAQAAAFGHVGPREGSAESRHLPSLFAEDSALARAEPAPLALPSGGATLLATLPLLDDAERVRGVVLVEGGPVYRARWLPAPRATPRWTSVVDRLRQAPDSAGTARDAPAVRGPVRVVPLRGDLVFVQTTYAWRPQAAPTIARTALVEGDSVRAAHSLAAAFGAAAAGLPGGAASTGVSPQAFRTRAEALYDSMRAALRRGDWVAFGAAYDALGRLLGRPPRR